MNKYFIEHPEMVMGEIKETTNQFGADLDVVLKENDNLPLRKIASVDEVCAKEDYEFFDNLKKGIKEFKEKIEMRLEYKDICIRII